VPAEILLDAGVFDREGNCETFLSFRTREGRSARRIRRSSDARAIRYCSRAGVKRSSLIEKNSSPDKQIRTPEALLPGKEGHHANTGRQRPKTELEARVGIERPLHVDNT
jgi:hypothetical protein